MGLHQALVAEHGNARDGVHVLRMQEVDEFRQIMEGAAVGAQQRMIEGNGNASITVLDIEDYGVAAHFTPVADDANPAVTGSHDAGEVHGAHFIITRYRDRLFDDRHGQQSGNDHRLARLEKGAFEIGVGGANGLAQFTGGQIRRLRQIMPGHQRNAVAPLGYVQGAARRRHRGQGRLRGFGHKWSRRPRGAQQLGLPALGESRRNRRQEGQI